MQDFLLPAENGQANHLVRVEVHGEGSWTAIGAFAALEALRSVKRPGGFRSLQKTKIGTQTGLLHVSKRSPE